MAAYFIGKYAWNAEAVTGTNTYETDWVELRTTNEVSFYVATTGTLTGTLTVEVSNATDDEVREGIEKVVTYDLVVPPAVSGAMEFGLTIRPKGWGRVRLSYTNATSSGTITAQIGAK